MREGWTYKKLGEVCEIYQPKTLSTEDLVADGDYPVYGANGIIGRYNSYNHEFPEVLLTCRGATCGTINISQPFSWINGNAMVIHRKSDDLSFDFLKYVMFSLDYSLIITGAAQPQITRQKLAPTVISYPPLSEQQSIVAELDKINELISLKKAQLSDLDSLAQSIFYDMFGDPIENEKGWEVKKLGEVVDITAKLVDPNQEPYCNQFHVGPANIIGGTGEIVDCLIAKDENLISGKYAFKSGDVLYSKIRPNLNKVAIPSFEGVCSADMYPLSIKTNAVNLYIMRLLMTKEFLKYAVNCSGRARMPKINREALFEFKFCLPPLSLQQEFAKRIELIEQQKAQISSTIKDLETLLASRMQYWFD